jgi:hypothetical protein
MSIPTDVPAPTYIAAVQTIGVKMKTSIPDGWLPSYLSFFRMASFPRVTFSTSYKMALYLYDTKDTVASDGFTRLRSVRQLLFACPQFYIRRNAKFIADAEEAFNETTEGSGVTTIGANDAKNRKTPCH